MAGNAAPPIPLESRRLPLNNSNGFEKDAPAISKAWCQQRIWSGYAPFNNRDELNIPGAKDFWLELVSSVESDLYWLLSLPAHQFWSQVLYDEQLRLFLENLLQSLPRDHDLYKLNDSDIDKSNFTLLHATYLVIMRLCTYKESNEDFFTPQYYAKMIYDKFIIDAAKIVDICTLFRGCNHDITCKMIGNVMGVEPRYLDDMLMMTETLNKAFQSAGERCQVLEMNVPGLKNLDSLMDLVSFVSDLANSVHSLLDVYPAAARPLRVQEFEVPLASFYQTTIIGLLEQVRKYEASEVIDDESTEVLLRSLQLSRHAVVLAVRCIVTQICLSPVIESSDNADLAFECLEEFFSIFTSCLSEKHFVIDYNAKFSIRDDFETFEQLGLEPDVTRKHYILEGVTGLAVQLTSSGGEKQKPTNFSQMELGAVGGVTSSPATSSPPTANGDNSGPDPTEMDSLISNVQDLLPHLGQGFVEKCLMHYDFKVEEVINAILEGNLAPHLAEMDQTDQKRQPRVNKQEASSSIPTRGEDLQQATNELEQLALYQPQRSVYDNDEFDVFSRDDIDLSRVHRGKRNKERDALDILNDKSHLAGMGDRFARLGIVTDIEILTGEENEYEDEYDDTYDEAAVGQQEPDYKELVEEQEASLGRKFVLPVALGGGKLPRGNQPQVDDEDGSSEDEEAQQLKNREFCRNPEEVRQEAERRRQEKMARRGGRKGGGPPPVRDVVGRAKGQGQDKSVLINRARKNENKGKHHRAQADRKSARGMF